MTPSPQAQARTPKTDAMQAHISFDNTKSEWVPAGFARQLETEASELREQNGRLREALQGLMDQYRIVAINQMVLRGYKKEDAQKMLGPDAPVFDEARSALRGQPEGEKV